MPVMAFPPAPLEVQLVEIVEAIAAQEPAELDELASLTRTRVLLEVSERVKALALRGLSDVETRQLHALDGAPTTSSWVAAQQIPGAGSSDVALARRLRTVPTVHQELIGGRLSTHTAALVAAAVAKARPFLDRPDALIDGQPAEPTLYGVLVDGVCNLLAEQTGGGPDDDPFQDQLRTELEALVLPDRSQRERVEAALVLFAQRCAGGLLPSGLALLLDALLPAQHERRARRAEEEAGLDLHRKHAGSGWYVRGDLDDETGEMLDTVLKAEAAVDPANPVDTDAFRAAADQSDLAGLDPEHWPAALVRPRSKRTQRHAALKAGLALLLGSGALGTRDKVAPHVVVFTDEDFLHGVPGALPGRTASGGRWSREQVRRTLCQSAFTRMVRDARRRIVDISHTQRTATAAERLIVHAQWGGRCAAAGCSRGPATGHRLVPHHGNLFSHTGTTALADTVPLCEQDHHYLHDDQRVIRLRDGRWIGPDGWVQQRSA